jgi:hypothetical protein
MVAAFPIELDSGLVNCESREDQVALEAAQEILRTGVAAMFTAGQLASMVEVCTRYGQDSMAKYLEPHYLRASM